MVTPDVADPKVLVRRIAAFGVDQLEGDAQPFTVPEPAWRGSLGAVVHQRLTGLAVAAWEADRLALSAQQTAELLDAQRDFMICVLRLERRLLELAAAFEGAGIGYVVLKGSAVAHASYPDPSWRPFGDLDVLVKSTEFEQAIRVLAQLGFRRRFAEPRPGFVQRFGHTALHVGEGGAEVDLHRALIAGPFGQWMKSDELFEMTDSFRLGGRDLPRLSDSALLLHACVHASLGARPPWLLPLRDVAQIAGSSDVDWRLVKDLGARWKLRPVFRHAFDTASRELQVRLPTEAGSLMTIQISRRERRALEAYTTDRRNRGGRALETLWAIDGVRAKFAYARALLFPDREFVMARTGITRRTAYLRRWRVPIRWLTARLR